MGRPPPRRSEAVRVPSPGRRASRAVMADRPEETRKLPCGVRRVRPGADCALWCQGPETTPGRRRDHTEPSQDYRGDTECAGIPCRPEGSWDFRRIHVEVRRQPAQDEPLAAHESNSCEDEGVGCDERGSSKPRLLIRGFDDLLCAYAGGGHGERPSRSVLPL